MSQRKVKQQADSREDGSAFEKRIKDSLPNKKPHLLEWDELQEWQKDNHYIKTGYRPPSHSTTHSLRTLITFHNETINIHTHLDGALLLLYLFAHNPSPHLLTFFLGAVACLTASATFHLFSNHSPSVAATLNRLDFAAITFLIWGSFVPSLSYGFACAPHLRNAYIAMITVIAAACLYMSLQPKFRTPAWRPFRSGMFAAMGLSAVLPVCHGLWLYGLRDLDRKIGLRWLVPQGVIYIAGAAVYAMRVPERWKAVTFDLVGSSHQIFHIAVVVAALTHLKGLKSAKRYHDGVPADVRCRTE